MKRTLAAVTTIMIAASLAITGVSTANADDAVAPVSPTTNSATANPAPTVTPPTPAPTATPPAPAPTVTPPTPAPTVTPPAPPVIIGSATDYKAPLAAPASSAPAATCLPNSAVRYTYDATNNTGSATVTGQDNSTSVLCDPVYITAVSWKYTTSSLWPQALDSSKTEYVTVDKVGTYTFGAAVTCGQGDIYAHYYQHIVPTPTIDGAQGWERFLNTFGFETTTPGYTYMTSPLDCTTPRPVASIVTGKCYWDSEQGASFKTVMVQYDNRKSNVPVNFSIESYPQYNVNNTAYDRTVVGGAVVEVAVPATWTGGVNYTVLAAGTMTALEVPSFESCPPEIPPFPLVDPAGVTFVDTCGVVGDRVVIPSQTSGDHFTYSTSDTTTSGIRTVVVTAVPDAGFGFSSNAVTSWPHTFKTDTQNNCVAIAGDPEAVAQTCAISSDGVVSGYLTVAEVSGIVYTIHPVNPTGTDITVTGPKTKVAPGDYLIVAAAKPGFILSGVTEWPRTVANHAVGCELGTHAFLPPSVSWVGQTCSATGTVSGYIAIDPTDFLSYFIGATQLVSAHTAVAPGTYVVNAVARAGDTIDGPSSYTVTITKPRTSCGNLDPQELTTLAFTGFDSGAGYLVLASALLMLGLAFTVTARRKSKA